MCGVGKEGKRRVQILGRVLSIIEKQRVNGVSSRELEVWKLFGEGGVWREAPRVR